MHIPKTAGRYLKSLIDRNFEPDKIGFWAPHCWQGILAEPLDRLNELDFISGHFTPVAKELFDNARDTLQFIVLRQPIERTISHYHYIMQSHPGLRPMTLEDFLSIPETSIFADNVQTRLIGSGFSLAEIKDIVGNSKDLLDPSVGAVLKASLEREDMGQLFSDAVKRLKEFDLIGIKEELFTTSQLLQSHTGVDMSPVIEKRGMHYRHSASVHRSTYRKVLACNEMDSALYLIAKNHFSRKYRVL